MTKFTGEQVSQIIFQEHLDGFNIVETSEWEDEGKYQYQRIILQDTNTSKYYALHVNRSGSYYSDYTYCFEYSTEYTCGEVEKVPVMTYEWKAKKT